jgi:hypothetical protein
MSVADAGRCLKDGARRDGNRQVRASENGKEKGPGILHLPALERSSGRSSDRDVRHDDTDPRQRENLDRDQGGGRPVARSTLRNALLAARQASGSMVDVNAYIVDQRTAHSR